MTLAPPPAPSGSLSTASSTTSVASGPPPTLSLDSLPSMPAAAVRIVGLCENPDVDLTDLASAVAIDPALSARILRTANSAAYSRGNEVTNIERAMMLMGIKVVKLTALGLVVSSTMSEYLDTSTAVAGRAWQQCLVEAVACRELAQLAQLRTVPEAFLAGLFDGMGQLLALVTHPDAFAALLESHPFPDLDAQRATLGMTTGELVRTALRTWGVPDLYARVVEESDLEVPALDQSEVGRLAAVLVLARQATQLLLGHPSADETASAAAATLDLSEDAVDTIAGQLGEHVHALADTLGVELGAPVDFTQLLAQARDQMVQTTMQIAEESMRQSTRIDELEAEREDLRRDSLTDHLTGLANRACFDDTLGRIVADRIDGRTVTGGLGIAMVDIDHFKSINDTHGHHAGDRVLATVGEALRNATRENELMARYGGEEFVLVMPIVDSAEALAAAAERIRRLVSELVIDIDNGGEPLRVTVSVGAVATSEIYTADAAGALTQAADRLLYDAKHGGRNTTRTDFIGGNA